MLINARDQWLGLEIIWNRCTSLCTDSWNPQDLWKMTSTWMSESCKGAYSLLVPAGFVSQFTVMRTWHCLAVLILWALSCPGTALPSPPPLLLCASDGKKFLHPKSLPWESSPSGSGIIAWSFWKQGQWIGQRLYRNMVISASVEDRGKKAERQEMQK